MKRIPASMERAGIGWEHIPLVKLSVLLKQMIWFSGECILSSDKACYGQFERAPNAIWLRILYRGCRIEIVCVWETRKDSFSSEQKYPDRFAIGVMEPEHDKFQTRRFYGDNLIKYKYSRYYSTAIDKIEDLIYDAQEVIDGNIAAEEEAEKRIRNLNAKKDSLCKSLDVKITSDDSLLFYREDDNYCLHFVPLENGFYGIDYVGGEYTEAEIKKTIKLVGGNPRAIAERILK